MRNTIVNITISIVVVLIISIVGFMLTFSTSEESLPSGIACTPILRLPLIPRSYRGDWSINWRETMQTLEVTITTLQDDFATTTATLPLIDDSLEVLFGGVTNLSLDLEILQDNFSSAQNTIENILLNVDSMEILLEDLNNDYNALLPRTNTLELNQDSIRSTVENNVTEIYNLNQSIGTLQSNINTNSGNITQLQDDVVDLQTQVDNIELSAGESIYTIRGSVPVVLSGANATIKSFTVDDDFDSLVFEISISAVMEDGHCGSYGKWVFQANKKVGESIIVPGIANQLYNSKGPNYDPDIKNISFITFTPSVIGSNVIRFSSSATTSGSSDPGQYKINYVITYYKN